MGLSDYPYEPGDGERPEFPFPCTCFRDNTRRPRLGHDLAVHWEHPVFQPNATMLISLTVGKVDAGVAVLLTEDKRLVNHSSLRSAALALADFDVCR